MAKNGGKQPNEKKDESDALFKLPLSEFIAARKTLAAELKKAGRVSEADRVKMLAKPSISAWAANQLYWQHRGEFDELIATGQRFREAQTSGRAAKVADMREALDARREALAQLSDLATELLRDAGSSPTPETIHRITTTLEAMSAYAALPDAQRPGRLSRDVDPPGFESFASLIPAGGMMIKEEPVRVTSSQKPATIASQKSETVATTRRKTEPAGEPSRAEQTRQAKIAAAKVSLQESKSLLSEARAKAQKLEAAQKKAESDAKQAEKQKREAGERFEKARVAAQEAARSARYLAAEAEAAAKAVEVATRSVERAAKELERLFGQ